MRAVAGRRGGAAARKGDGEAACVRGMRWGGCEANLPERGGERGGAPHSRCRGGCSMQLRDALCRVPFRVTCYCRWCLAVRVYLQRDVR